MKRVAFALALLAGCSSPGLPPLALAPQVDLARFMGDWYVIASIPTFIETGAHNAVESYRLGADGSIATTFTFREGGFDGELKRYTPRGFVVPGTGNAVWGMRFVWPIKADFRIAWLAPDYGQVVIGREKRDYVWIMARQPQIPQADYQRLLGFLREQGYDAARLRKVPQQWP
ncbi:MAG: lipocalin family protein [Betaproteobacteria bacterium]|nr:lipocalin family protein [Betaproteobacteria bacterium]